MYNKKQIDHTNAIKHYLSIKNYDYETVYIKSKKHEKMTLCYEFSLVKICMSVTCMNESFCVKWKE